MVFGESSVEVVALGDGVVNLRLRGVPMMSRSMRRCVRWSLVVSVFVVVQLAQP